jgi:hypothetical protein
MNFDLGDKTGLRSAHLNYIPWLVGSVELLYQLFAGIDIEKFLDVKDTLG